MVKKLILEHKNEIKLIGMSFVASLIVAKIIFLKEDLFVMLRFVAGIYWLAIIPGYFLGLFLKKTLLERMAIGIALALAVLGIASYNAALIGVPLSWLWIILPPIIVAAGILLISKKP